MRLGRITPRLLTVVLLSVAIFQGFVAWGFQRRAADDFKEAYRLSQTEVDSPDSEPESVEDYRAILATLEESVEIRREIDALLAELEDIVADLRLQQSSARATSTGARVELRSIGATLGGAVTAARTSFDELENLRGTLGGSARLAARIAEELEELDRRMGPTLP